jgi:hypothetical protein
MWSKLKASLRSAEARTQPESDRVCSKEIQRAGESPVVSGDFVTIPV